jgi:hypothetical protein
LIIRPYCTLQVLYCRMFTVLYNTVQNGTFRLMLCCLGKRARLLYNILLDLTIHAAQWHTVPLLLYCTERLITACELYRLCSAVLYCISTVSCVASCAVQWIPNETCCSKESGENYTVLQAVWDCRVQYSNCSSKLTIKQERFICTVHSSDRCRIRYCTCHQRSQALNTRHPLDCTLLYCTVHCVQYCRAVFFQPLVLRRFNGSRALLKYLQTLQVFYSRRSFLLVQHLLSTSCSGKLEALIFSPKIFKVRPASKIGTFRNHREVKKRLEGFDNHLFGVPLQTGSSSIVLNCIWQAEERLLHLWL